MAASTDLLTPPAGERALTVSREFDAPRKLVFRMWTESEHLARWWGPAGFTTIECTTDIRPGGLWSRRMRGAGGLEVYRHGVYREIVAPERLVFTYFSDDPACDPAHETVVTVTFDEVGGKTRVTLHQELFETIAGRDSHQRGWTGCLGRFADYLAAR